MAASRLAALKAAISTKSYPAAAAPLAAFLIEDSVVHSPAKTRACTPTGLVKAAALGAACVLTAAARLLAAVGVLQW